MNHPVAVPLKLRAPVRELLGVDAPAAGVAELRAGGERQTLAISEDYNSTVNGLTQFPVVADPENIELNRLQLQYRGLPKTVVTIGRQRINLDDQRFVGAVGWRLDADQVARLDAVSSREAPYPYFPYFRQEGFTRLNPPIGA